MGKSMGQMWRVRLEQTPAIGTLQDRIARMLLDAIRSQALAPGAHLPSSRLLAHELGVARNTASAAFERLVADGVLQSRSRSGYFVHPDIGDQLLDPNPLQQLSALPAPDWDRRLVARPGDQRNIVKPADWASYPYPFVYGQSDPSLLPLPEWRDCCERALRGPDARAVLSDQVDRDDPLLVEQIRTRLLPRRGVWARDSEILVTVGAQQALYLVAQLLLAPRMPVGVEDPGYPDARNIFALRQARLLPLAVDASGLVIDRQLARCRYLYVTPSHQCPTTVTLPLDRRRALLEMAASSDIGVIEDDYEPENVYDGKATPALKSLDTSGRVIYVGSLSKTFAPGVRLGFVAAAPELIAQLRALRRLMLRHPASMTQRALALFVAEGHHDALLRRTQQAFRQRARVLLESLAHELRDWSPMPVKGGSACWVRLPEGCDDAAIAERAMRDGVLVEAGSVFFADPARAQPALRMGFSSIGADRIEAGVRALRAALA